MNPPLFLLTVLLLLAPCMGASAADELVVYPAVPGLAASQHYRVRVRTADDGRGWKETFAWETTCKTIEKNSDAYFDTLAGWTHTYANFETAGAVEVEIARVNGQPIRSAAVHPRRKASACVIRDGKALVRIDQPCLVAVDIDGQMDGQDTGKSYKGPPIHTISIFANPVLEGKPRPGDPGVLVVKPGEKPPSDGPWTTLYFLPGVHDVGLAFPLRPNRQYYIPGDALVYGTFSNTKWADGHDIRIFGHGTLSGARLKHPKYVEPAIPESEYGRYRPIEVVGATDTRVEGITIADSATHSLMLVSPFKEGHPNEVTWTKIFTWRANGDGINPFGNTRGEDCFLRTQDDSLYVSGLGIRRTVLWNDANGSSFVLSSLPQLAGRTMVVEDCDVIYARAKWHHWSGGRVFNMRGEGGGAAGAGVVFRNINIEDPRPTLQQFFLCMTMPEPYSKGAEKRGPGDLSGLIFQNVSIAAPSILGEPQLLWGQADARIRNITFENLTVAGKPVRDPAFFKTNEFVDGLRFTLPEASATSSAKPPLPRLPDGDGTIAISGELKQWHKVTLTLDGPFAHERDTQPNPFTDVAFNVTFTHESGAPKYVVPGYFAADGDAADSSAQAGTKWRAHLSPDKSGTWHYSVSLLRGQLVAVEEEARRRASPAMVSTGSFVVAPSDKSGRDFRGHGRLQYVGKHHLQFAGSREYFMKAGPDAPETLLAYADFDGTRAGKPDKAPLKTWAPHESDWRPGDPTWRDGRGKGLIGALNYLAGKGVNTFSFLPYNAGGDGDNVWPFVERDAKLHYDCSKLDQWGVVFDHATARGLHLHFKLQENEIDDHRLGADRKPGVVPEALDGGRLGIERKLYCRELIARFGHALALNWNLGEENTQSTGEIRDMAKFLHDTDSYRHPIVLHTFPDQQDEVYTPLLGDQSMLTGTSLQNAWNQTHRRTLTWVEQSARAGRPWVVANDEQGGADTGVPPDPGYAGYDGKKKDGRPVQTIDDIRKLTLWGNLMAGGAGVEYYFGYQLPQNDLACEDFRSRDSSWDYARIALEFFRDHRIPFWEMKNANALVGNAKNDNSTFCFAKSGGIYLVYLPNGGTTDLDLSAAPGTFTVMWFNPRSGGELLRGSVQSVEGGKTVPVGVPPSDPGRDWLAVIRSGDSKGEAAAPAVTTPSRIRIDPASKGFVDTDGRRFTPCGVSYYRPGTGWAPQLWKQFDAEATRQDFHRMKRMGLNVARVFVSFGSFYTQPGQLDPAGLVAFDRMLDLADEAGIYLHPTGPDHWEGMPPWMQGMGDIRSNFGHEAGLQALEDFWRMFAGRYRGRSTIWAYDLRNEPALAWDTPESRVKWEAWRTARQQPVVPVPAKDSLPSEILADYQRFRESLAEAWVARQAAAIRAADPEALVTVGLLQWSVPAQRMPIDQYTGFRPEIIARHLDFLSLHFYPLARGVYRYESSDAENANLAVLECMTRECAKPGKPVVIAEFGWYGGGPLEPGGPPADEEQQARWCRRVVEVTASMACGWINWGLYDTPEAKDVSRHTGLITSAGADKAWGRTFASLVRGLPQGRVLPTRPDLPWESCTMDGEAMTRFQAEYQLEFQKLSQSAPVDGGNPSGIQPAEIGIRPSNTAEKPH